MKNLYLILIFLISNFVSASDFKFRVQCATSKQKQFENIISKIPELSHFMMPNGEKIYFSGKYFNDYSTAESRLNQVLALGFCNAEIRVFKDNQYLPHVLSVQYLPIAIAQNNKNEEINKVEAEILARKITENQKTNSNKFVNNPKVVSNNVANSTFKSNNINSIQIEKKSDLQKNSTIETNEISLNIKKEDVKSDQKLNANKNIVKPSIQKFKDVGQKINEELTEVLNLDLKDTTSLLNFVDELPSFKIQLIKTEKTSKSVDLVNNLLETVYQYETPQSLILTVGYYKESTLAQPKVMHYVLEGYPEAKVVGIFKGYVVSKELAEDLLYFYTYKKSKNLSLN
jgi:hypothetical protein